MLVCSERELFSSLSIGLGLNDFTASDIVTFSYSLSSTHILAGVTRLGRSEKSCSSTISHFAVDTHTHLSVAAKSV